VGGLVWCVWVCGVGWCVFVFVSVCVCESNCFDIKTNSICRNTVRNHNINRKGLKLKVDNSDDVKL
jgi:hypothetical protein